MVYAVDVIAPPPSLGACGAVRVSAEVAGGSVDEAEHEESAYAPDKMGKPPQSLDIPGTLGGTEGMSLPWSPYLSDTVCTSLAALIL
mmetsp:Transcript_33734/g.40759  ORF Transcript_33734/g.40759 Transcript_33734/m.40759 type:complete len:87 (+) Transcript_33734:1687-1947(+)